MKQCPLPSSEPHMLDCLLRVAPRIRCGLIVLLFLLGPSSTLGVSQGSGDIDPASPRRTAQVKTSDRDDPAIQPSGVGGSVTAQVPKR